MGLSVIIPSKLASNLSRCLYEVRRHEPTARIIVLDDGLASSSTAEGYAHLDGFATFIKGLKPFIFSRNCNLGIMAAGKDDVILLNDDALVQTCGGFTAMQRASERHCEYGVIAATTNVVGNADQHPVKRSDFIAGVEFEIRNAEERAVAFICVLIPRVTIARVGLLDERFVAYGWEDNDYCRRVRDAGLKVGIFDGCFVDHARLQSTFRGHPLAGRDNSEGAEIYRQKWGDLL